METDNFLMTIQVLQPLDHLLRSIGAVVIDNNDLKIDAAAKKESLLRNMKICPQHCHKTCV